MNPWDTKMTYELSEHELLEYVSFLRRRGDVEIDREQTIRRIVEQAVAHWQTSLGMPQWQCPQPFHTTITFGRTTLGFHGDNDTLPLGSTYKDVVVKLPQWMPREYVEYIAEMQVREQYPEND